MLARVVFMKCVELDENAFLFIDYFQLHITWDSLLPDMLYDLDQCSSVCGKGPCFVFSFSNLLQTDTFVKYSNGKFQENEMKKQKTQNTSPLSNFIEQT